MYLYLNNVALSRDHFYRRKAVYITCSECVFIVLFIQRAKSMRRVILSSVACPVLPCFSVLRHEGHVMWEKCVE
jgi:hypothetical protein